MLCCRLLLSQSLAEGNHELAIIWLVAAKCQQKEGPGSAWLQGTKLVATSAKGSRLSLTIKFEKLVFKDMWPTMCFQAFATISPALK